MATVIDMASKLKLVYIEELDGKIRSRSKTFSNINGEASNAAFLQAGEALGALQNSAPEELRRVDEMTLMA